MLAGMDFAWIALAVLAFVAIDTHKKGFSAMGYFERTRDVMPLPSDSRNAGVVPREGLTTDDVPGYWVEIKNELNFGDVAYRSKRVVRVTSKGVADTDTASTEWEMDQFGQATLERAITRWNLEVPLKPEFIQQLKMQDAAFLMSEINQRNPNPVATAEGKDERSSGSEPTSNSSPTEADVSPEQS